MQLGVLHEAPLINLSFKIFHLALIAWVSFFISRISFIISPQVTPDVSVLG